MLLHWGVCVSSCRVSIWCVVLSLHMLPLGICGRRATQSPGCRSKEETGLSLQLCSRSSAAYAVWRNVWARDSPYGTRACVTRGAVASSASQLRNCFQLVTLSSHHSRHSTGDSLAHTAQAHRLSPIQDYQDVSYRKPHATVGCHTLAPQEAEDLVRLYSALGLAPPQRRALAELAQSRHRSVHWAQAASARGRDGRVGQGGAGLQRVPRARRVELRRVGVRAGVGV